MQITRQRTPSPQDFGCTTEAMRPKRYACEFPGCSKRYSRPCLAQQHLRSHFNERNYMCTFPGCGKRFLRNSHLKVHLLIHKEDKPHVCPQCGKGFNTGQQISRHLAAHRNNSTKGYSDRTRTLATTHSQSPELGPDDAFVDWTQLVSLDSTSTRLPTIWESPSISEASLSTGDTSCASNESPATDIPMDVNSLGHVPSLNTYLNTSTSVHISRGSKMNEVGDAVRINEVGGATRMNEVRTTKIDHVDSSDVSNTIFSSDFDCFFQDTHIWWCNEYSCRGAVACSSLEEIISHYDSCHQYIPENLRTPVQELAAPFPNNDLSNSVLFLLEARYLYRVV